MKNVDLVGDAGDITPCNMKCLKETGNGLGAVVDRKDSVGIIDSHFLDAEFFTEFERFDRHSDKMRRSDKEENIDYVSICSPNYLHDSHMRFALRSDADAICEKPLVLNPWNIDGLQEVERDTGHKINTILQLRVHPAIVALREKVQNQKKGTKHEVDLTYITSRGHWYLQSWKGDVKKSGGIATNIGVHFFDMLHHIFGDLQTNVVHASTDTYAAGYLEYQHARVRWFLSVNYRDVPEVQKTQGQRTYRSITVDGEEIEFSGGFTDLHTLSYQGILAGQGFGLEENRVAIQTVRSEEHTSELQSLMRISYAVFCLKKKHTKLHTKT